ncbi:MAG: SDR family NAD(P)-dependent oxidoreductase [Cytophagales bacterium]|nr:SDR family NAD(P)-dependent oxidoreductase [Cytophagales bacterium]
MNNSKMLAVVTGGSEGIGKCTVLQLLITGFDVVVCSRSALKLQALKEDAERLIAGATIYTYAADVKVKSEVNGFIKFIKDLQRPVEILVNNAGQFIQGSMLAEKEGTLEQLIEVNLYSAYYITRGIVPLMISSNKPYIFNMCSVASIKPYVSGGSYCISKFALLGFNKVLREELKNQGIRVSAILPGATYTSSWDGVNLPEDRFIPPEDIAEIIVQTYMLHPGTVLEEIIIRPQLGDI